MNRFLLTLALLSILVLATAVGPFAPVGAAGKAAGSDWPQWRGSHRDGRSTQTGLLAAWPENGPKLAWRVSGLGGGYSSVSIAGKRIYTMGDLEDGQYVLALGRDGGALQWKTRIGPVWEDQYGGPRATPTLDGGRVYAMGTEGDLVCLEAASGKLVWSRNLAREFGGTLMKAMGTYNWKFSESPLIDGDRVVVTPGAKDAVIVALNKKTGKEIWRAALPELGERGGDGAGYSSIVVSEAGGTRQYVQLVGRGLIGVAAKDGRFLWGYNRVANDIANIATPIVHEDHVFVSTGYGTGSALIRLKPTADGVAAEEVYFLEPDTLQNHHGGLILHDGVIYTGTGHNKGFPIAVELMTGKVAWGPERNEGKDSAALTFADGHLYFRYQNGLMVLVEATPEAYRQKGSFMIPDVEKQSWAHPVIAGGKLYLREQDHLFCYDITR